MMRWYMMTWLILLGITPMTSCGAATNPVKSIEMRVVNDEGQPVEGATVIYIFNGVTVEENIHKRAKTDANGVTVERGPSYFGAYIQIVKNGYYKSTVDRVRDDLDLDRWTREVVLREIRDPIPMYAKKVGRYIPRKNVRVGYDFTVGDWATPHGKGAVSHIYFMYSGSVEDYFNYGGELKVSFPNEGDGLKEVVDPHSDSSRMKLPHEAPANGYQASKLWQIRNSGQDGSKLDTYDGRLSYYLRINTIVDQDKDVVSANYGKIYGDIRFHLVPEVEAKGRGPGYVSFTYYYNPSPNERNVEFDPARNLLDSEIRRSDWEVDDP